MVNKAGKETEQQAKESQKSAYGKQGSHRMHFKSEDLTSSLHNPN
jgi:hypothetical protein